MDILDFRSKGAGIEANPSWASPAFTCRASLRYIAVTTTNPPEALTRADIVVRSLD